MANYDRKLDNAGIKVPPGGFRGGFLAKLESGNKESGGGAAIRVERRAKILSNRKVRKVSSKNAKGN